MPRLHKETLNAEQIVLLPLLRWFSRDFFLVGGTAVALHIGHRRSIDFDLFSLREFKNINIRRRIAKVVNIEQIFVNKSDEFTLAIKGVKMTFFHYPFMVPHKNHVDDFISMPSLLDLAAMKAYALGHRARWKDYIDLYFVMKEYHGIDKIVKTAKHIFGKEFNEKLFRSQLAYFKDIDYSEKIIYMPGYEISDRKIQRALLEFSLI